MADPGGTPSPNAGGLLGELERLVPDLPTTTLLQLAARLDELVAEDSPQLAEVEEVLRQLLDTP